LIPGPRYGQVRLLDGGMGTALIARGLPAGEVPEEWVLERPWEVEAVHRGHLAAGAELILTCTFNLARLDVAGSDLDAPRVARAAAALARSARAANVAGCIGATGLARPGGAGPSDGEFLERYASAARALAGAGVDLLWLETQMDVREARAALSAARRTGLPVVVTAFLIPGAGGMVALDGTPAADLLEALWREGASAVGVNCVAPELGLVQAIAAAAVRIPVPIVVKPNGGLPGDPVTPASFASGVAAAVRAGATLAGGCCGAGPAHLRALAVALGRQARG